MEEKKTTFKTILVVALISAVTYYLAGPVGLGVLALFWLLKKN